MFVAAQGGPISKAVIVRYETRPDATEENQRLVERVFAQLAADNPDRLRYAAVRLADGVTFVHVAVTDGDADPLADLEAFADFRRGTADRVASPPQPTEGRLIGSYRLFNT